MPKESLDDQIAVHISSSKAIQIRAIAEMQGETASAYIRDLIEQHLAEKHHQFQRMQRVFGSQKND